MAAEVEARLRISAQDRTAKAFAAVEARLKKAERLAAGASRRQQALAKAERGLAATGGTMVAAGSGRLLAGLGAMVAGGAVAGAIRDYAALERQMTRIGLAAGATDDETKRATRDVGDLANQFALPLDQAVSGLDALVATGMDLKGAMTFLPSILRTAQASGAATDEMAASANSLATSFKVTGAEMQQAFDMLVTGGQAGQFELKDMAQYLPSLTASAAKLGFVGLDGTKKLVAMLQTVRQVSGTSGEAATAVADAIEKTLSPTVAKAFQKRGVDIGRVLETAAKKGKNQFEAVVDVLDQMTRGMSDTQRNMLISSIYTDKEARRAVTAMIELRDAYRAYEKEIGNSAGATERNLKRVLEDQQAAVDRLANSWGGLWKAIGRGADAAGATGFMEDIAGGINALVDLAQRPEARASFANDYALEAARHEQDGLNRNILDAEGRLADAQKSRASLSANALDLGFGAVEDRDIAKQRAAVEAAMRSRAEAEARALWGAADRGFPVGAPQWMNTVWPGSSGEWQPPKPGEVPLPPADPRRVAPELPAPGTMYGAPVWPSGPLVPPEAVRSPAAAPSPPSPSYDLRGFEGATPGGNWVPAPPPLDLSGADDTADKLRQAMEAGGGEMRSAGTESASAIRDAARELRDAAGSIAEGGRQAAAAISGAKVQVPSPGYTGPVGRGAYKIGPNANLGQSMPNAGRLPGSN